MIRTMFISIIKSLEVLNGICKAAELDEITLKMDGQPILGLDSQIS
jgi:hypothetical protein